MIGYKKFNPDLVVLEKNADKKVTHNVIYNGKMLSLKTPRMLCRGEMIKGDDSRYLDVMASQNDEFFDVIEEIDHKILQYAAKINKLSQEKMEESYKYSIRPSRSGNYMRLRLVDTLKVYDINDNEVDLEKHRLEDLFKAKDEVLMIITLDKIRISNQTVKCNWYIYQIKLRKKITDCLLSDSSSSGEESEDD